MEKIELQEFIHFFMYNKNLTRSQKLKRDTLLVRDCGMNSPLEDKPDSSTKELDKIQQNNNEVRHRSGVAVEKYISPKKLQDFLLKFNQDDVLKYTCHLIDTDETKELICSKCKISTYSIAEHAKLIEQSFKELTKSFGFNELDNKLLGLISAYLGITKKPWSSNNILDNWQDEDLQKWGKEHIDIIPNPGKNIAKKQKNSGYKLPKSFKSDLTGNRILSFSELVLFFKSLFHLRRDNSLRSIIEHTNEKLDNISVSFSQDNFYDNIELFTDIDKLIQAYKNIIRICKENQTVGKEQSRFELSFYNDNEHTYFIIHHLNSTYGKTLENAKNRIGESQSRLICNQINGLCDLFIEADFGNDVFAKINLWDEQTTIIDTIITEKIRGVKYILRF